MNDNVDLLATLLQILEAYILLDANLVVQVRINISTLDYTLLLGVPSCTVNYRLKCSRRSLPPTT